MWLNNNMGGNCVSKVNVYVGSYASAEESGVEVFSFDEQTGKLTKSDEYIGLRNPTFLNVDVEKKQLYAVSEMVNADGSKSGEVVRFHIDPQAGTLQLAERIPSTALTTCHVQRDAQSQYLTVTSYHGGMTALISLNEDGSLHEVTDIVQHVGTSVDPERQDRPHPHSSFYSKDGKYLYIQDLGLDKIICYRIDQTNGKFVKQNETLLQPGSGPRHLVFHPSLPYAYVINELNSTVTTFSYDESNGELTTIQTISTLPEDFAGENGCAEITMSSDGKYVYGSNRGHDSIVVYEVNADNGQLAVKQYVSTEGGHPRHFALTPNEQHVLVANRDGNNVVTFKRDANSGLLEYTGVQAFSTKPVCVIPVLI